MSSPGYHDRMRWVVGDIQGCAREFDDFLDLFEGLPSGVRPARDFELWIVHEPGRDAVEKIVVVVDQQYPDPAHASPGFPAGDGHLASADAALRSNALSIRRERICVSQGDPDIGGIFPFTSPSRNRTAVASGRPADSVNFPPEVRESLTVGTLDRRYKDGVRFGVREKELPCVPSSPPSSRSPSR